MRCNLDIFSRASKPQWNSTMTNDKLTVSRVGAVCRPPSVSCHIITSDADVRPESATAVCSQATSHISSRSVIGRLDRHKNV